MGKIFLFIQQKYFFSDLKFRSLNVEAEVVDGGVAQGEEDGVHGKTLVA